MNGAISRGYGHDRLPARSALGVEYRHLQRLHLAVGATGAAELRLSETQRPFRHTPAAGCKPIELGER